MSSERDINKQGCGSKRKSDEPTIISADGQKSEKKINRGD